MCVARLWAARHPPSLTACGANCCSGLVNRVIARSGSPYPHPRRFWCLLIVAAYVIAFRVMAVLALRYVSFLRR